MARLLTTVIVLLGVIFAAASVDYFRYVLTGMGILLISYACWTCPLWKENQV